MIRPPADSSELCGGVRPGVWAAAGVVVLLAAVSSAVYYRSLADRLERKYLDAAARLDRQTATLAANAPAAGRGPRPGTDMPTPPGREVPAVTSVESPPVGAAPAVSTETAPRPGGSPDLLRRINQITSNTSLRVVIPGVRFFGPPRGDFSSAGPPGR